MPVQLPFVPSEPNYQFATVLDGVPYIIGVRWNARDAAWYMDLFAADASPICHGIKIVLGALLGRRTMDPRYPGGTLTAVDLSGKDADATLDDLGVRVVVYFYTFAELVGLGA